MKQLPKTYILPIGAEVTNIHVNDDLCNKTAMFVETSVNVTQGGESYSQTQYNIGVLTGAVGKEGDFPVYNFLRGNKSLWTTAIPTVTGDVTEQYTAKAQNYLNTVLNADRQVMEDLLLASEFVMRLERKGKDCSKYRAEIKRLYARLQEREDDVKAYSTGEQTESPSQVMSSALEGIVNDRANLGFIFSTSVIVTAIVVASFSALAWYVFYTDAGEGRSDCRKSKELNKILANVDSETKEEIYDYIDRYADSFYKRAMSRAKWAQLMGNVKTIAIVGGLGYLAYRFLFKGRE